MARGADGVVQIVGVVGVDSSGSIQFFKKPLRSCSFSRSLRRIMPASAGRVRMPHNNRVSTSSALQTSSIWQKTIGYVPVGCMR